MIRRKKIGALVFAFILTTVFLNLDAGRGSSSTQLQKPFPQKPVSKPLPKQAPKNVAGQVVQNKGLWESIKEKGLQEGVKSWWDRSQAVESAKKEQARELLEKNAVAHKAVDGIEQKLQKETDPSKKACLRNQLETFKQFIVNNKKALGALGALAVAAGTAAYFAPAKGEKPAEGSAGQAAALDQAAQISETSLEPSGSVRLTDKEALTSSLPFLDQSPAGRPSPVLPTNVQVKPTSKSWTRFLFAPPILGQRFPSEGQQQSNWGGEQVKAKRQSLAGQTELQRLIEKQQAEQAAQEWLAEQQQLAEQAEQQPPNVRRQWTPPEQMRLRLLAEQQASAAAAKSAAMGDAGRDAAEVSKPAGTARTGAASERGRRAAASKRKG